MFVVIVTLTVEFLIDQPITRVGIHWLDAVADGKSLIESIFIGYLSIMDNCLDWKAAN